MNMARKSKQENLVVEKEISESISKNHPDRLEGTLTEAQNKRLLGFVKQVEKEALTDKEGQPLSVTQLYNTAYAEMVGKGINVNIETMAINQVANELRKKIKAKSFVPTKKGNTKAIIGAIIGDCGVFDKIANMRSAAQRFIDTHSIAEARHEWTDKNQKVHPPYINDKNEVLDLREKLFGKPNPDYKKPLKDGVKDASRKMLVFAKISGTEQFVIAPIQTNDRALAYGWESAAQHMFEPMTTFANVKGEAEGDISFTSSSADETKTIFKKLKEEEFDFATEFLKVVEPKLTVMADLEEEHELVKNAWDRLFFIKGIVTYIGEKADSYGRLPMGLMDENDNCVEIKVKIPKNVPITFGESSTVIVIGKSERFVRKEGDEWVQGDVGMIAYGIYPMPDLSTPKSDNSSPEPVAEEENINCWEE